MGHPTTTCEEEEVKLDASALAHAIVDLAEEHQAEDIVLLDLRAISILADYFVICSGTSTRQLQALVDAIEEGLDRQGKHPLHIEGTPESGWLLMDYGDVVVHIFSPEQRAYYALERFWEKAQVVVKVQ
ncbi:MAG: ribosome silencing factor [Anaerolineae bacterium]